MRAFDEAERQSALLAAIERPSSADPGTLRLREQGERAAIGLAAYRNQAAATACKALASVFPTVQQMLGPADFEQLAGEFRRLVPPTRGDLGESGAGLPDFIERHAALLRWPWLADSARLDLAVHRSERAADATLDVASLALLETTDPSLLRLEFMPGTALLRSPWPIASIHAAHRLAEPDTERAFEAVRSALAEQRGESVLVVRRGWRAVVHPVDEQEADWSDSLLAGTPLASALQRAGTAFGFAAWLARAVAESRLSGAVHEATRSARPACGDNGECLGTDLVSENTELH